MHQSERSHGTQLKAHHFNRITRTHKKQPAPYFSKCRLLLR
ncbi:hypothetical protein HMPREF9098_0974 [Kingella denitrificans ATCC 33394]|uniref:Uncharacterized protein n=1 Tax=Kingella denitrificans ATCC 33394 TaxID=888741 RepID=F0EYP0_9NEIS|nr:hypothetical protein HMPREF9098_0974 [Kingella denitrificans ATCC 33394]